MLRHMSVIESWDDGAHVRVVPPPEGMPADMVVSVFPGEDGGTWASITTADFRAIPLARVDRFRGFESAAEALGARLVPRDWVDSVEAFHSTFGHDVGGWPRLPLPDVRERRLDMLAEELSETEVAAANDDILEYVDGLIDAVYIAIGGLLEVADPETVKRAFAEVHRANMSKAGPNGEVVRREDGKILKPEGWMPPDIAGALFGWELVEEDAS